MHALQHRGMDWLCTLHQSMQTARLYPSQLLKTTAHSVNSKLQYVLSGVSSSIWALYCTAAYRQEGTSIPSTARKSIDLGIIIPRMWTIQQWGAQTRTGSPFNTDSSFLCGPQCLAPLTLWDMAQAPLRTLTEKKQDQPNPLHQHRSQPEGAVHVVGSQVRKAFGTDTALTHSLGQQPIPLGRLCATNTEIPFKLCPGIISNNLTSSRTSLCSLTMNSQCQLTRTPDS